MNVRRLSFVAWMAVFGIGGGCTSKMGASRLLPSSPASSGPSAVTAPLGDSRYDDLVRQMQENGNQATRDATPQTATQKVTGAIKKASATVTTALTPKPRVRKAPDPIALDSMPKKISVDLCYQAGRLAESNGNPAAAIAQYERGLKDQPDHLPTLISLARLYDRQDDFDKAEQYYRRALKAEPDNAMAHNDLGLCLSRHNRSEAALESLRKAVSLEPNRKLYRNNLATVLVDLGRVDEAWTELKAAHPPAVAHYNLGYLLYHAGNRPRAQAEFTLAQQADPSLAAAQQMLDQLAADTAADRPARVAMAATPTPPPAAAAASTAATASNKPVTAPAPTKVQVRIEDIGPQSTSVDRSTRALPVTAVHAPSELRRMPPTDPDVPTDPLRAPGGASSPEPVPLSPADIPASPSAAPDRPAAAPFSSEFPIRRMSAALIEDSDELDLPTPALLDLTTSLGR